jgi:hypothetical protein
MGLLLVPTRVDAKKGTQIKAKDLRVAQVAELGEARKPARVVTIFAIPGRPGELAVACAREARPETAAHCGVLDESGKVLDDSLGMNVLRAEDRKKGDHLEILFKANIDKEHIYISANAPLSPESLDAIGRGFQTDLSMLEFMTGLDAFPIGVGLEGGVKVVGEYVVFGQAATTRTSELLAEFKGAPPPPVEEEGEAVAEPSPAVTSSVN